MTKAERTPLAQPLRLLGHTWFRVRVKVKVRVRFQAGVGLGSGVVVILKKDSGRHVKQ